MTNWTIIGGGIQAVTIAIKLRTEGLPANSLTMIDPHASLCEQFKKYTARIDMPFLRSPCVHHCHPDPFHLKKYAKKNQFTNAYLGKYKRPQRDMFMYHIHDLVHQYDLNDTHMQGYVEHIERLGQQWHITLSDQQQLITDYVIIAAGCTETPNIPDMYQNQPDVQHIFEDGEINYDDTSHVVGSGISAAHLCHRLLTEHPEKQLHLWMNKDIEIHDFDADPGWLGPKNMTHFSQIESSEQRMHILTRERHKGSMPQDLYLRLKKHIEKGRIIRHQLPIKAIKDHQIHTKDGSYTYDHILLATGFKNTMLQAPYIKDLILNHHAPMAQCGLPSITPELEWLPQLFVAGDLADLELGPFARNIMGGREAANRIASYYTAQQPQVSNA
ncbi:lysine N(6)-hydroxylase/L-ornithine N(5)-oxygenase family protein [Staphylococcus auricularis]|uniref:NAD(P)-binding domain-containing protein n=1 Tax=Staphylococcus auricularis TaxID=29379 RepID=UPI001EF283D7|nr:FAD/NAD(P)-binding protein [Staphylococcus auricularis]MCG7341526.1 lysine N(6)-hydroxylase/L-ornithine N(5)-oxygenase family protein [Staphylococcus auricularis]